MKAIALIIALISQFCLAEVIIQAPEGYEQTSRDITQFIQEDLTLKLPQTVKEKTEIEKLIIKITPNLNRDGIYSPPTVNDEKKHLINLKLNPNLTHEDFMLIAHEYFHFIHYLYNPNEKDWIKEGLADYFVFLNYNYVSRKKIRLAIMNPSIQLEEDFDINRYQPEKYGNSFLFFNYLFKKCNIQDRFWNYVQSNKTSREGIDHLLQGQDQEQCQNFKSIATSFSLTKKSQELVLNLPKGILSSFYTLLNKFPSDFSEIEQLPPFKPIIIPSRILYRLIQNGLARHKNGFIFNFENKQLDQTKLESTREYEFGENVMYLIIE